MRVILIVAAFLTGSIASAGAQMTGVDDANATGNGSAANTTNATGMGAGMSNSSAAGCAGMNTSAANVTGTGGNGSSDMNSTAGNNSSVSGSAYSVGVSKNETGGTDAGNISGGAGLGSDMNASMQSGSFTADYTFAQKESLVGDVKDQVKQLDLKIDEAKRNGDNETARALKSDRDRLKKQLGEIKRSNADNWDRVQNNTMSMMKEMNITK